MLSVSATLERFEAIAGRQTHDLEPIGGIELKELAPSNPLEVARASHGQHADILLSYPAGRSADFKFDYSSRI